MPLLAKARRIMRTNLENVLENIENDLKPKLIVIGTLTVNQLAKINGNLATQGRPQMTEEVVFTGMHIYKSRVIRDGYTIEDVLDQITSAMEGIAEVLKNPYITGMQNPQLRSDRYGNKVNDQAIFECDDRYPRVQLYSVIPKGDKIKPRK
jgi:hypothetical protein